MGFWSPGNDRTELPGQCLSNARCHNHHEGAKNGPRHVRVLPGGPDWPVRLHRLLPVQVRAAWLGRGAADGGLLLPSFLFGQIYLLIYFFAQISSNTAARVPDKSVA